MTIKAEDIAAERFTIVRADLTTIKPTIYAVEPWIPMGAITNLAGDPKAGKGLVTCHWLAGITTGAWPGTLRNRPSNVLWIGDEDSWDETILPRLAAAGADPQRVFRLDALDNDLVQFRRDFDVLRRMCTDNDIKVVAFESLVDHIGVGVDDHRNTDTRHALVPLKALVRELHIAALCTSHLNKLATGTFRQRLSGSGAYYSVPRAHILVAGDPGDTRPFPEKRRVVCFAGGNLNTWPPAITFEIKSRDVQNPANSKIVNVGCVVNVTAAPHLTVDDVLAAPPRPPTDGERAVRDWLHDRLADGPELAAVLYDEVERTGGDHDISVRSVKRHRAKVGVEAYQQTIPGPWYWRLNGAQNTA